MKMEPEGEEPRRPTKGEPYEFLGVVIGRQHIGKRCAFIDMVRIDAAKLAASDAGEAAATAAAAAAVGATEVRREAVVHLVGDHVARPEPLTVERVLGTLVEGSPEYHTIFAARSPDAFHDHTVVAPLPASSAGGSDATNAAMVGAGAHGSSSVRA